MAGHCCYSGFHSGRAIDTFSELQFSAMKQRSGVLNSCSDVAFTIVGFMLVHLPLKKLICLHSQRHDQAQVRLLEMLFYVFQRQDSCAFFPQRFLRFFQIVDAKDQGELSVQVHG